MQEYRELFTNRIWERGKDYFKRDLVKQVQIKKNCVSAVVDGTQRYEVEVHMDSQGEVLDATCDCPYANEGNYCKHMAAVLMKMESLGILTQMNKSRKPGNEWENIIQERYQGYGWINIADKKQIENDIVALINQKVKTLTSSNIDTIFQSLTEMVIALNALHHSLSVRPIIQALSTFFFKIAELSLQAKGRIWAQDQCFNTNREDVLEYFLFRAFTMDQKGLQALDLFLQEAEKLKQNHIVEAALSFKIKAMEQLKYTKAEIVEALGDFNQYEDVIKFKLGYYEEIKKYEEMKTLLSIYKAFPFLDASTYMDIRESEFKVACGLKEYPDALDFIIEKSERTDCNIPSKALNELADNFETKAEWKAFLQANADQIERYVPFYRILDLYFYAHEYERFYQLILKRCDLEHLMEYAMNLMEYDLAMFQQVFFALIIMEMQEAKQQNQYMKICQFLAGFKGFEANQIALDDILIYAKEHYENRPAFMRMLKNLY